MIIKRFSLFVKISCFQLIKSNVEFNKNYSISRRIKIETLAKTKAKKQKDFGFLFTMNLHQF